MFYGEYKHTIDRKDRLIIPAKFREIARENLIEKFFITRGLDGCLFIFAEDEWKQQERLFRAIPFTKSESRKFKRLYFSGACEVICDKQGRILIPQNLKEFAEIKRDVVIVGVSNRFEIWSRARWAEFYRSSKESFEEVAEKLIEEG